MCSKSLQEMKKHNKTLILLAKEEKVYYGLCWGLTLPNDFHIFMRVLLRIYGQGKLHCCCYFLQIFLNLSSTDLDTETKWAN